MKTRVLDLLILGLLLTGCDWAAVKGNGQMRTDQRTTAPFSEIQADGYFQIEWRSGAPAVSITTDQNLLRYIQTQEIGDRVRIYSQRNLWPSHGVKVLVSSPVRTAAKISGATRLSATQLNSAKFAVESSGAATITLDGTVNDLWADMTGASRLKAGSLQAKSVELSATGAADAELAVSSALRVSITGAGKVTYSGNPSIIEKHVTGAGSVRHKQ
jgi:hypothetical protein